MIDQGHTNNGYAEPGAEQDELANHHRERAVAALEDRRDRGYVAIAEALLALEARLDELACYVSRLG